MLVMLLYICNQHLLKNKERVSFVYNNIIESVYTSGIILKSLRRIDYGSEFSRTDVSRYAYAG